MTTQTFESPLPVRNHSTFFGRKVGFLASPLGLAIIMPLIILICGGGAVLVSHALSSQAALAEAERALTARSMIVEERITTSLGQASPVIDGMRAWLQAGGNLAEDSQVVRALFGFAAKRAGVAQAYAVNEQSLFQAVRHDPDGRWRHVRIDPSPTANGKARRRIGVIDEQSLAVTPVSDEPCEYDPRQRPWFRLAVASGRRIWTEPYVFATTKQPGVTCAEPLLRDRGSVAAVIAVDFSLASLSDVFLQSLVKAYPVMFTADRILLASNDDWIGGQPRDQLMKAADLTPTEAKGFFAALPPLPEARVDQVAFSYQTDQDWWLATVRPLAVPGGPTWYLGRTVARSEILGPFDAARTRGLWFALACIVVGVAVSLWFAHNLARSRADTLKQRTRAKDAEAKVQELGAYRLIKLLGKGGMGEVWLAEHRFLARPAAIKRITAAALSGGDSLASTEVTARFSQEARITASLRSRNTIELYDYGISADGNFFYVMELLDGMDLRDLVEKAGALPLGRVINLLAQSCNSLSEAHDRSLVHRDIKPENLYICRRADEVDVLKVLDFGIVAVRLAPEEKGLTQSGLVQGTPATMSPEQAMGRALDGRSDIYSLGCVAWFLITGSDPYPGVDPYTIIAAHINDPVPSLTKSTTRKIPPALAKIIEACLAKEPEGRPANARVLAEALLAVELPPSEQWAEPRAKTWWGATMPRPVTDSYAENTTPRTINAI